MSEKPPVEGEDGEFVRDDNQCVEDLCPGKKPSPRLSTVDNPEAVLYNDVPASLAGEIAASLRPHAILAFESPALATSWSEPEFVGKIAFIKCLIEQALPPFLQNTFLENSGVQWTVKEVECGHSPWASKPDQIVSELQELLVTFSE